MALTCSGVVPILDMSESEDSDSDSNSLSSTYLQLVACLGNITFNQACKSAQRKVWHEAMSKEIQVIHEWGV